jgi:mannose-6-phosphate isomerase-like protein (cupin superfamily)
MPPEAISSALNGRAEGPAVNPATTRNPGKDTAMKGYVADIETLTKENADFRQVLYTGHHLQLALMSLLPGQDIGIETHATHDQFFRIEKGKGEVKIDGVARKVKGGDAITGQSLEACRDSQAGKCVIHGRPQSWRFSHVPPIAS